MFLCVNLHTCSSTNRIRTCVFFVYFFLSNLQDFHKYKISCVNTHTNNLTTKSVCIQCLKRTVLSTSEVQEPASRWGARCRWRTPPLRARREISRVGHTDYRHGDVAPRAAAQTQTGHTSNSRTQPTFHSEQRHKHTKSPSHWPAPTQVT